MLYFRLDDGRDVTLRALHILPTRSLHDRPLVGREETELRIIDWVRRNYPGERIPILIRWLREAGFTPTLCVGWLSSGPLEADDQDAFASVLILCWFVHHLDRHMRDLVEPVLAGLDWNAHARNLFW